MKSFFVTLTIAMMIQVSMAGSLRLKRDNEVKEGLEEYLKLTQKLVEASEAAAKGALKEMPKTAAYQPFREDLEDIMKDIEAFHSTPGNCYIKTTMVILDFTEFIVKYAADGISEEAMHVFQLLEKYGGSDIDKEFAEFQTKYSNKKMDPKVDKMSTEEFLKTVVPVFEEVC